MDNRLFQPKILYRIYGEQKPDDLAFVANTSWMDRFLLLTTTDYGEENLISLKRMGFEVLTPRHTTKEAGENTAAILNYGLAELDKRKEEYAI